MILEGRVLAEKIISELSESPAPPGILAVVQVGEDPVSTLYIAKKKELAEQLGVKLELLRLPEDISEEDLIVHIQQLNDKKEVRAIILQLPLPEHLDRAKAGRVIAPEKDIDGFHCILKSERYRCLPPTVLAIDELLDFYQIEKENKKIVIVGGGFLVGGPLAHFWQKNGLDVEVIGKDESEAGSKIRQADIVVVATGGAKLFKAEDFKLGATVIDASTVSDEGKLRGDVEIESWRETRHLAPVPGGVGAVTVAMLFKNFYELK